MTMAVIVGNRSFFPDHLARSGRAEMLAALAAAGISAVVPSEQDSKFGAVETHAEALRCAALFARERARIDGVIVTLPNFGDERAVAETLRRADLRVPVLVQATPDQPDALGINNRRDSFCGKMSVCANLRQYGIPYSLTSQHTESPASAAFATDLRWFAAVCRVVRGLRGLRIGCIGARPAAFNTVRYSEKLLEANGISVEPVDLGEILGRIARLADTDSTVLEERARLQAYIPTGDTPQPALLKMAKLGAVLRGWMREVDVTVSALQCWTTLQEFLGIMPCAVMSMLSDALASSACEADVCGTLSMHALALAAETPSALLDWNNNYGDDPERAVCFHCSNLPRHFLAEARLGVGDIIASTVGPENACGTVSGRIRPGPMSFARFSTDDANGVLRGYVGEGRFTDDPLQTFGGAGVVHIPGLQGLLRFICEQGFEHHVAASLSRSAAAVHEAAVRYLGWQTHWHEASVAAPAHTFPLP
jgi:L-fucose isomerase-like protein